MTIRKTVGALATCAYLHVEQNGRDCVVIDPGAQGKDLAKLLSQRNLRPIAIALTHGHDDHCSGIPGLLAALAPTGQRPPIAIHAHDASYLGPSGREANLRLFSYLGMEEEFLASYVQTPAADIILSDGMALPGSELICYHSPGHSPGSSCFYCKRESVLYSGDTLFRHGLGRSDFPDSDEALLMASLRRLPTLFPPDCLCYPGHGPETRLGDEAWITGAGS